MAIARTPKNVSMTEKRLLLCTDMDRTIIPNGLEPETNSVRHRLQKLVNHPQVMLAYVSGRDCLLMQQAIQDYDLPIPDYAITNVGSQILEIKEQQWQELSQWQQCMDLQWHGKDASYIYGLLANITQLSLQEAHKQSPHKISYYLTPAKDLQATTEKVQTCLRQANLDCNLIASIDEMEQVGLLDILPKGASKLHAIEFLRERLQLQQDELIFAGDSGNDLAVLTSSINSVLVNNASQAVRQQAVQISKQNGTQEHLYLAQGQYLDSNGNYAGGVLEGVWHYAPEFRAYLSKLT